MNLPAIGCVAKHGMMLVLACAVVLLGACASGSGQGPRRDADYVFVYLKTGPASATNTPAQKQEIFKGHMANMKRLSEGRKLLIAGPFDKPADTSWRGLFLFDVPSVEAARQLVATDPGVRAGEFVAECVTMRGSTRLREFFDIYKAEDAKRNATPRNPTLPPPVRAFVIVTTRDVDRAINAIASAAMSDTVIWWGRFGGEDAPGGVLVFDADDAGKVRDQLGAGPWIVDGWWSDSLLTMMPRTPIAQEH